MRRQFSYLKKERAFETRIRDFIETKDGFFFSVASYHHPKDKYVAFLRYYPSKEGERERKGIKFKKIASVEESFRFLENFKGYLFRDAGNVIQCVPKNKVLRIHHPWEKLKEICTRPRNFDEEKIAALSEIFDEIPLEKKGISGSFLIDLQNDKSDIDFVIYGIENHEKARKILKKVLGKGKVRPLNRKEWIRVYGKRFPSEKLLSFEEFVWHEKRKFHRGVIGDKIFDVLLVRDFNEIKPEQKFKRISKVKMKCRIKNSSLAFDFPAIYKVVCEDKRIKEVVSFSHTYAGQGFEGEEIEVCGFLEEAIRGGYHRIVAGSVREGGGYIKLHKF